MSEQCHSLSEKENISVRNALDRLGFAVQIEEVQIQVEEVAFDDGSLWSIGRWFQIDPKDPSKLIEINHPGKKKSRSCHLKAMKRQERA